MRSKINLPVIHQANQLGLRLVLPTLEKVGNGFRVTWNYQATSFAIQGNWVKYDRWYAIEDYSLDKAANDLTDFVKREYNIK